MMTTFSLTIQISQNDLNNINNAGELLTIVSGVTAIVTSAVTSDFESLCAESTAVYAPPNVVWQAFAPFETSTVSWSNSAYLLYVASNVTSTPVVQPQSTANAVLAGIVPFTASATFGTPITGSEATAYGVCNLYTVSQSMAFGLCQAATVNGAQGMAQPLNTSYVPMNQQALFTPTNSVQVFLQTGTQSGLVLQNPISGVAAFQFSQSVTAITIQYNSAFGCFQQLSST